MKYILLFIALMFSTNVNAQYRIGDIQIDSFQEVFNPDNDNLWGKKEMGIYNFRSESSDIWTHVPIMSGLIIENELIEQDIAYFIAKDSFDPDEIFERLKNQLTEQFGEGEEVKDFAVMQGVTGDGFRWIETENEIRYSLQLLKYNLIVRFSISKIEEIPDF